MDMFAPGDHSQGHRCQQGQGLPGRHEAARVRRRSRVLTVRTSTALPVPSAPRPTPPGCIPGTRLPGHMGAKQVTQLGPLGGRNRPRAQPAAGQRIGTGKQGLPGRHQRVGLCLAIAKIDESGAAVGEHQLDERLVETEANIGLLHEVVRAELASYRQGTASAKSRGQVSGSGPSLGARRGRGARGRAPAVSRTGTTVACAFPPMPRSLRLQGQQEGTGQGVPDGPRCPGGGRQRARPEWCRVCRSLPPSGRRPFSTALVVEGPYLVITAPEELEALLSFRNISLHAGLPHQ